MKSSNSPSPDQKRLQRTFHFSEIFIPSVGAAGNDSDACSRRTEQKNFLQAPPRKPGFEDHEKTCSRSTRNDMIQEREVTASLSIAIGFKEANPDIIPILHCDGAVSMLLDDIHDIGFEVFNPVQPGVPGHLPRDMKQGFGEKFAFWGAIDQQDLLPNGTDEETWKHEVHHGDDPGYG